MAKEEKKHREIFSINPLLSQVYLRKIGCFCSSYFGNDIYFLKEYVDLAVNEIGEDKFIEMLKEDNSENKKRCNELGKNWIQVKEKLNKFEKIVDQAKGFYDKIENKKFKDIKEKDIRAFMKRSKKIPLIKQDIFTLAVFLIRNTTLQRMTIPVEALRVLEQTGYRKVDLTKGKNPTQSSSSTTSSSSSSEIVTEEEK